MVTGFAETPDRPRNGTKEGAIRRYLVVSTLSNYAGQIVTTGVWFALTPFVLHRLGPTQYGLWALVASFVAYGQLLDAGSQSDALLYFDISGQAFLRSFQELPPLTRDAVAISLSIGR